MRDRECLAATRNRGFTSDLQAAVARTVALRARASRELTDATLFQQAVQELDTAHEELREAECQLHARADDLANAFAELERERMQARDHFDGAPEAYVLSDPTGRIVRANRCASELLCVDPQFLPRKPLIGFVDRADRASFFELITKAADGGAPSKREVLLRPRRARCSVACIASVSRATTHGSEGTLRWIFSELPGRAASRDDEPLRRLVVQGSQELRTNLSSVSGWLQVVRQNLLDGDAGARAVTRITRAVRDAIALAEHLAEYARVEREDAPLECTRISLIELIGRLVEETRMTSLQRGFRLSALLTSGVPAIVGDPRQLYRALSNLFSKVARSTVPGGELYIAVAPSSRRALVTIRSSGCGIDLALLQGSETGAPEPAIDTDLAQARRCLELHGATVQSRVQNRAAGSNGYSSIEISFPRLTIASDFSSAPRD